MARSDSAASSSSRADAISAAEFHTWRLEPPSSNEAISRALGSMTRSRTRAPSSAAIPVASSSDTATESWRSQIDSR
jgi:hypothetical protein